MAVETFDLEPENTTVKRSYELSPEEWIGQQQASGENVLAEPERPPLIGVPEGFARSVQTQGPPRPAPPGPPVQQDDGTWRWGDGTVTDSPIWEQMWPSATMPAVYRDGEQWQIASWSAERIAAFQAELAKAGLLNRYRKGMADDATVKAFKDLLGYANRLGTDYNGALRQIQQAPLEDPDAVRDALKPYVAPDYATVREQTKSLFRDMLDREPSDAEMTILGGEIEQAYRADYDQERQAFEYQAQIDQQIGGEPSGEPAFRDVDPAARVRQAFEERYGDEMEGLERSRDALENRGGLMQSFGSMSSMIGS